MGSAGVFGPMGYGPAGIRAAGDVAEERGIWAGSGEGEADAAGVSMTRAASLSSRRRMVANSALASAGLGDGVPHGQHQPVGGGVKDEPHLIGDRRAATVRSEASWVLCSLIRFSAWPRAQ